jgi:hypothetical protein
MVSILFVNSNGAPFTSFVDGSSDTMNKVGSCPGVSSGFQLCFYYAVASTNVATTTLGLSCACSSKTSVETLEIAKASGGTLALDQSEYDTAYITTAGFTSGNTGATTHTPELAIGGIVNSNLQNRTPWPTSYGIFSGTNGWIAQLPTSAINTASQPYGWFYKVLATTGTQNLSGTWAVQSGNATIDQVPGLATFY